MKTQKLFVIVASVCLLVVFVSGSAYAQDDLDQIIAEYLAEYQKNLDETTRELNDITSDLRDCFDDLERCERDADDGREQANCFRDFAQCLAREGRDKQGTCTDFLREFQRDYRSSSRDARRADVEDEFQESDAVQGTVASALGVASLCY